MPRAQNSFDSVARFYDPLVRLVFGKAMTKAQTVFFPQISMDANVLIIGGGTGWIAEKLLYSHPDITVIYIDSSARMIEKAKSRFADTRYKIQFICGTEDSIPPGSVYDVVITNFFLDLFSHSDLERVIGRIQQQLKADAYWIVTDFVDEKWWNSFLLRLMYIFFKVTTGIQVKRLPTWGDMLMQHGLNVLVEKRFYGRFISAVLFQNENR